MGLLISNSDFIGKYKVSTNSFTASVLTDFTTQYETIYLKELLGKDLSDLFIADLTAQAPTTPIYLTLYNYLEVESYNKMYVSQGMKDMMLGFIYYEFNRKDKIKQTINGAVVNQSELSREAGFTENSITMNYNDSVDYYKTIQMYINDNLTDYPLFKGLEKQVSHWAI